MLTDLRIRMVEHIKSFNIEEENIKYIYETYICNFCFIYITEMKNTPEGFHNRMDETAEEISELKDMQWKMPR